MSKLLKVVRAIGLMPLAKPLAERMARSIGMNIVPHTQVPGHGWLGLPMMKIRTILDIGGCDGSFARYILTPNFPNATIHSFEPSKDTFPTLKKVADATQGQHVAHNFGLGEKDETLTLHSTVDLLPASSLLTSTQINHDAFPITAKTRDMTVEIKVLDEIAPSLTPAICLPLLVKIDVQGFEDRVIRGGTKTIARASAVVVEIQQADLYEGQPTFKDIFDLLSEMGFAFTGVLDQHARTNGDVLYYDAVFVKPDQKRGETARQ